MNWYQDLYVSENIADKAETLREELENGRYRRDVYLITLAMNGKDLLDIRKASCLARESLRRNLPMIVGLSSGYENAVNLSCRIVTECCEKTGDVDLRSYLGET